MAEIRSTFAMSVGNQFIEEVLIELGKGFLRHRIRPSAVTLNPAIRGHFKTGHRDWPET
jgi:hypothetical protein